MASKAYPVFSCPVLFTLVPPLAPPPFPSLWRTPAYSSRLSVVGFSGDTSHGSSWQVFGCFLPYCLLQRFCCCLMRAYFLLRPDFGLPRAGVSLVIFVILGVWHGLGIYVVILNSSTQLLKLHVSLSFGERSRL